MVVFAVICGVKVTAEAVAFAAVVAGAAYKYYQDHQIPVKRKLSLTQDEVKRIKEAIKTQTRQKETEEPCTCRRITLTVLYANMRSINTTSGTKSVKQKVKNFKTLISTMKPDIIAITETWLKPAVGAEKVEEDLGLGDDYCVFRQDRADPHENAYSDKDSIMRGKRGGGLLIAIKSGSLMAERDYDEELSDYIMTLKIERWGNDKQCLTCAQRDENYQATPIAFSLVYQRPLQSSERKDKEHVAEANKVFDRITRLPYAHGEDYQGFCLVGDFNMVGADEKNMKEGMSQLCPEVEFVEMTQEKTHSSDNCLDWVVASPGLVDGVVKVLDPRISDHNSLFFQLQLGLAKQSRRLGIDCKNEKCMSWDDL